MLLDKSRREDKSKDSDVTRINSYLCDGGCPKNGTHHANHYNIRVYDLEKKRIVVSRTYYSKDSCSLAGELTSILEACAICHKYATIYNDSTTAINYVKNGVAEGSDKFIMFKDIVEKINNLVFQKELKIEWWDNKKERNYADCKLDFKEEKRSSWKRRYRS